MASSSDWISQVGEAPLEPPASSGWIAAMARGGVDGFCDASPFAKPASPGSAATSGAEENGAEQEPLAQPDLAPDEQEDAESKAFSRGYNDWFEDAKRVSEAVLAAEQARVRELRLAYRALDAAAVDAVAALGIDVVFEVAGQACNFRGEPCCRWTSDATWV